MARIFFPQFKKGKQGNGPYDRKRCRILCTDKMERLIGKIKILKKEGQKDLEDK